MSEMEVKKKRKPRKNPEPKAKIIEVSFPNDIVPIVDWLGWHYDKQLEFTLHFANCFETVFKGANGSGKTHILYWNLVTAALGLHPYQPDSVKANKLPV